MPTLGPAIQQNTQMRQEQQLTAQQYQALELLAAPLLELQERLAQELSANPVLEMESNPLELLSGDPVSGATEAELRPESAENIDRDDDFAELAELAENWSDVQSPLLNAGEDAEKRQEYFFQSLSEEEPEFEPLSTQLQLCDAPDAVLAAAADIVDHLDDQGFLGVDIDVLAGLAKAKLSDYQAGWQLVRSLDPPGIGAKDLADSLSLQLERRGEGNDIVYELVEKYLDELARNHLPQVAKKLHISLEELRQHLEALKGLKTAPGRLLAPPEIAYAAPELTVKEEHGEWVVSGRDRWMPRLRINPEYLEMYHDPTTPAATKQYLREKIMKAQELFHNLEFRQSTLERITEALLVVQPDFFRFGPEKLKPMTMKQIADRIGVHETTVSRAVSGKYLATPFGVFEYRKFFSGGYTASDGEEVATSAVQQLLRDLVAKENPAKPLSDEALAHALAEKGFQVARRTVAKYRGLLGILPTNLRKKH